MTAAAAQPAPTDTADQPRIGANRGLPRSPAAGEHGPAPCRAWADRPRARRCKVCGPSADCADRWLYVVGEPGRGPVKVGITVKLPRRLHELRERKLNPRLEVLAARNVGCESRAVDHEARALRRLKSYRTRGDWFGCAAEVAAAAVGLRRPLAAGER